MGFEYEKNRKFLNVVREKGRGGKKGTGKGEGWEVVDKVFIFSAYHFCENMST
jgi:hypothetical protein